MGAEGDGFIQNLEFKTYDGTVFFPCKCGFLMCVNYQIFALFVQVDYKRTCSVLDAQLIERFVGNENRVISQ